MKNDKSVSSCTGEFDIKILNLTPNYNPNQGQTFAMVVVKTVF